MTTLPATSSTGAVLTSGARMVSTDSSAPAQAWDNRESENYDTKPRLTLKVLMTSVCLVLNLFSD